MNLKTLFAMLAAMALAGCGTFERADPAARSARATYGAISVVVSGSNSTCNLRIGDGAMAAADGNGDVSQPTTTTTTVSPQFETMPYGDPISIGIQAIAGLAGKGIDAYAARVKQNASGAKQTGESADCADGNCGDCGGSNCGSSCVVPPTCDGGACEVPQL